MQHKWVFGGRSTVSFSHATTSTGKCGGRDSTIKRWQSFCPRRPRSWKDGHEKCVGLVRMVTRKYMENFLTGTGQSRCFVGSRCCSITRARPRIVKTRKHKPDNNHLPHWRGGATQCPLFCQLVGGSRIGIGHHGRFWALSFRDRVHYLLANHGLVLLCGMNRDIGSDRYVGSKCGPTKQPTWKHPSVVYAGVHLRHEKGHTAFPPIITNCRVQRQTYASNGQRFLLPQFNFAGG